MSGFFPLPQAFRLLAGLSLVILYTDLQIHNIWLFDRCGFVDESE